MTLQWSMETKIIKPIGWIQNHTGKQSKIEISDGSNLYEFYHGNS